MQLAHAAAARTLTNWAEPEQPAAAVPTAAPQSDPQTTPPATPAPTQRPAAPSSSRKQTDPAILFTRFAAVVRDCIALEARLTAGAAPAPRAASLQRRADPRRALLREAFRRATENHPDRTDLLRETTTRLDEELAADEDQTIDPADLFATICDELGIEIDLAILPDELLGMAPDPCATSPP